MRNKRDIIILLALLAIANLALIFFIRNPAEKEVTIAERPDVLGETTEVPTPTPTESIAIEITPSPTEEIIENTSNTNNEEANSSSTYNTPVPTPEPLSATTAKKTEVSSGSIIELEYKDLKANTLYKIKLDEYPAKSNFVLSWKKGIDLQWSKSKIYSISDLITPPIDDDGPIDDTLWYSGLIGMPESKVFYIYSKDDKYQVNMSVILPSDDVDPPFQTQSVEVYNDDAGASYSRLDIVTRDEWGASPGQWDSHSSADIDAESRLVWYPVYYSVKRFVVHHTATAPNYTTPAAAVRSIYLYHAYVRGWGDIGYNFLIDQNGTIYEGKLGGDGTLGYHAFGAANQISLAISLIGNFTYVNATSDARISLTKLLAEKSAFYDIPLKYSGGGLTKWLDPSNTVFGHRATYKWDYEGNFWTVNATACPGQQLYERLPYITANAIEYRDSHFTLMKEAVSEVKAAAEQPHNGNVIIVKYNVPESTPSGVIEGYLPKFSGITGYTIDKNIVTIPIISSTIEHPTTEIEYLVPPTGWYGYDNEFSTFTGDFVINGPEERAKTLLTIFKLDPRVESADFEHYLEIQK